MTRRIPWLLPARTRYATGGTVTPAPVRGPAAAVQPPPPPKRPAWTPPEPGPTATPYLDLTDPTAWPGTPLWLIAESAVLASLATAGGDLTAHQAVHGGTR